MRQQPGPISIFRLTENRRSRLDVGRHGGNPHSVPGGPVIPFWRHHEQLKNTGARNTDQQDPMPSSRGNEARLTKTSAALIRGGAASQSGAGVHDAANSVERRRWKWSTRSNASARSKSRLKGHQAPSWAPAPSDQGG